MNLRSGSLTSKLKSCVVCVRVYDVYLTRVAMLALYSPTRTVERMWYHTEVGDGDDAEGRKERRGTSLGVEVEFMLTESARVIPRVGR